MSNAGRPDVLFVVEAGASVGMGHVWRCVELAGELSRSCDAKNVFSINDDQAALRRLAEHGLELFGGAPRTRPIDEIDYASAPGRVVFDLPRTREREVAPAGRAAGHRYTIALDHFLLDDPGTDAIVNLFNHNTGTARPPEGVGYFEGPEYAIVRRSFDPLITAAPRGDRARLILVALGGSDPSRHMLTVLDAIPGTDAGLRFRLVVGPGFPHADAVMTRARELGERVEVLRDAPELERSMAECDVALTNGGTTFMECLALGLPTMVLPHSVEESRFASSIARKGAALALDSPITSTAIATSVSALAGDHGERERLASAARRVVDGRGRHRVARIIHNADTGRT